MKLRNAVEEHVIETYEVLKGHFPTFCGCEVCRADVIVYALNRLPARYVATLEGSIVTEVNLDKQQARASIEVALMEGFKRVSAAPRCGRQAGAST